MKYVPVPKRSDHETIETVYDARDAVARFEKIGVEPPRLIVLTASIELEGDVIWSRDKRCRHDVEARWSGVECTICHGTYCL
jgi:hypothetical protein